MSNRTGAIDAADELVVIAVSRRTAMAAWKAVADRLDEYPGSTDWQEVHWEISAALKQLSDHRILGPDDIEALRRVIEWQQWFVTQKGKKPQFRLGPDLARMAALIGDKK